MLFLGVSVVFSSLPKPQAKKTTLFRVGEEIRVGLVLCLTVRPEIRLEERHRALHSQAASRGDAVCRPTMGAVARRQR